MSARKHRPHYPHVYCPELKRRVQRAELWDLLSPSAQPLSFQCPQKSCRTPLSVFRIYPDGTSQEVHISTRPGRSHQPSCLYDNRQKSATGSKKHQFKKTSQHQGPRERDRHSPSARLDLRLSTSGSVHQRLEILIQSYLIKRAS